MGLATNYVDFNHIFPAVEAIFIGDRFTSPTQRGPGDLIKRLMALYWAFVFTLGTYFGTSVPLTVKMGGLFPLVGVMLALPVFPLIFAEIDTHSKSLFRPLCPTSVHCRWFMYCCASWRYQ